MDARAVRGVAWTILSYGGNRVVTVATTIILARLLEPSDFGLFALATLAINFISLFSGLGLGQILVIRQDLDRRGQGTLLTMLLAAGVAFAILLAAAAPLIAEALRQPRLDELLIALAAILSFTGVNWFYDSVLQKELEFRHRFVCQLARTVVYAVTALALAVAGAGVWSLVAGFAAGHVANGIALLWLTPYRVPFTFDRAAARDSLRGGKGFVLQNTVDFGKQNADYLVIGRMLGAQQLGYYTMAFRQAELPHYALADPLRRVTFPMFARMAARSEDVGRAYLVALGTLALGVLPLAAVLSGAAAPFVETFFGQKWLPMIPLLAVLGIWGAVRPLEVTAGWMLNSMGHATAVGRVGLGLFALLVPAIVVATGRWGVEGVAWVMLGHAAAALAVFSAMVDRRIGVSLRRQWSTLAPVVAAATVSWATARGIAGALEEVAPLLVLAASSLGALAAYLAVVRLLAPDLLRLTGRRLLRAAGRDRTGEPVPSAR